jgi:hypothetical protein
MEHKIPFAPLNGPLPIPHLLQWPDYSEPMTYSAIIPEDMSVENGDTFFKGYGASLKISVLERRPAKGDWSKQAKHKNPHYIKFIAK